MPLVFVNGDWKSIDPPVGYDPVWTEHDCSVYAVAFGFLISLGLPPQRAEQIAEAHVISQIYPGTTFDSDLELALRYLRVPGKQHKCPQNKKKKPCVYEKPCGSGTSTV